MRSARILFAVALGLALAGAPARLRAQDVGPGERAAPGVEQSFLLRVWETADGLMPTTVRSIAQARDGYVWMAAQDGFVRFDGARAVLYSGKNVPGLPTVPKGSQVFADASGLLWAATTDGRLFSFDQVFWREYRKAHGWPGLVVDSIVQDHSGRLIFSGARGAVQYAQGHFTSVPLPEFPIEFRPPLKAVLDANDVLWLASSTHVWRQDGDGWKLVCSAVTEHSVLHGVAAARGAGVWIATSVQIRKYVNDAPVATLKRPEGFLGEDLALLEDFRGNLWAGSPSKGLRIWMHDGRVLRAGHGADSLSPQILSLVEDRERNVLVGTDGAGLARFKPRPFLSWLGQLGGMAGALVDSIGQDASGRMLIGTEGSGLRQVGGDTPPALITTPDGLLARKQRITSLLRTREGEMIAAVAGKGLCRLDGDKATLLPDEPLGGDLVRALFEDSHGRLWVGHEDGIVVREKGVFTALTPENVPALTHVRAIAEDRDGTLWFATKEGLARWHDAKLEHVPTPAVGARATLLSLFVDHAGVLWIGVESKGLLRVEPGHVFLYGAHHGLPILSPGALLEDGDDLWVTGEKGIVRIARESLDAVSQRRSSRLELEFFNRADGLPSDACRRGYQPTAFKADDGQFWFATHKGVISVHPQEIVRSAFEPRANIEEIRAESQLITVTPANRDRIDIPAGTRHMTIRCSVPSLGKPDYARFQYTLEGFDDVWHDGGGERVIRFYDVQPGKYRFMVRAIGADGRFVEQPVSVALVIHPFIWQEWWFRASSVAALVFLVAWLVWRSQQQRIRLQEEKLRAQEKHAELELQLQQAQKMDALGRLAGGIAHDFNNLLTSVGGNAELLQAELPANSSQRPIVNDIAAAAGRARDLVSQILTFSRRRTVEKVPLDPAPILREAVQLLRAGLPAMTELQEDLPDSLPPIMGDAAQLQRVIMNLGTNAAQAIGARTGKIHISAQECCVRAEASRDGGPAGRYVRLVVGDDGRGMDDETLSRIFDPFFTTKAVGQGTGLGLSVVHGIVEEYGGRITVESEPESGTTFQIYLPVTDLAPPAPPAEVPTQAPAEPEPAGAEGMILLVDDESVVIKVCGKMLQRFGYAVESYTDPLAAADAFAAAPDRYRLLLTDFAMPKLDGVELARRVWAVRPEFPAILYTGYGGRLTPSEAQRIGFVELLPKPFTMPELSAAVAHALATATTSTATH
jgi:signal transduction histidine kinase/ligand-binding sensor domain-containing protein/CheY-like chemotaxis protein